MNAKIANVFLILVLIQALHSIEEYYGKLWENFPPAIWLTGLVSKDHHLGFLIINIGLFIAGLMCWFFIVKPKHKLAKIAIMFWLLIELANGIVHPIWSIMQNRYTPGLITAPFLFITALYLLKIIYDDKVHS
jgi:hypothetical protein